MFKKKSIQSAFAFINIHSNNQSKDRIHVFGNFLLFKVFLDLRSSERGKYRETVSVFLSILSIYISKSAMLGRQFVRRGGEDDLLASQKGSVILPTRVVVSCHDGVT